MDRVPSRRGTSPGGRRPAIIVQAASASEKLPTVPVVPLTTQLDALRFPGTVLIEPEGDNGLRVPSVALVFQMTAIDRRFVDRSMGNLSAVDLQKLWSAFRHLTAQ